MHRELVETCLDNGVSARLEHRIDGCEVRDEVLVADSFDHFTAHDLIISASAWSIPAVNRQQFLNDYFSLQGDTLTDSFEVLYTVWLCGECPRGLLTKFCLSYSIQCGILTKETAFSPQGDTPSPIWPLKASQFRNQQ